MVINSDRQKTSVAERKQPEPIIAMVPLFNWRTIVAVIIGFIIGVGLALGYWIMSPTLGSSGASGTGTGTGSGTGSTGFYGLLGMEHTGLYESKVRIQIVSPGSDYISLSSLQQRGEYYAAKANSLPFFEFLSQELAEQTPELSYTVDELDQIITTEYDYKSELPAIKIITLGADEHEAILLAELVPQAFNDYLIAEEGEKQQKEYHNTLEEIESVKVALYEAEQELDALATQDTFDDPSYIALSARLEALERELNDKAIELTTLITLGNDLQQEYDETMQQMRDVSAALIKAEQELKGLEEQGDGNNISSDVAYITLNAKISALERELDRMLTGYINPETGNYMTGLVELMADGVTQGTVYENVMEKIEAVSVALAEAKKEIAVFDSNPGENLVKNLDYRLTQIKVDALNAELVILQERLTLLSRESINRDSQSDTQAAFERTSVALAETRSELKILESQVGYDQLAIDLNYQVAKEKVDNLNDRMEDLARKLSLLLGERAEPSDITGHLVAGKPSIPYPVLPERPQARNTLLMGAIIGIAGAWVLINWRWIAKVMLSSSTAKPDEDEKET